MVKVDRKDEQVLYMTISTSDASIIELKIDNTQKEKTIKVCSGMRSIEIPAKEFLIASEIIEKYMKDYLLAKQDEKSDKWIVHRTLRKSGLETFISEDKFEKQIGFANQCLIGVTKYLEDAQKYSRKEAIKDRDILNKDRIGKQYLWVISKVKDE